MSKNNSEEENSNQTTSTPTNNNQPEFDVKIPDIEYATEGYEVDISKYPEILEEVETNKTD